MTTSSAASPSRPRWPALVLALPAVALLAGCSGDEQPAAAPATSAAASPTSADSSSTATTPTATTSAATAPTATTPATTTATGAADAPACPDVSTLAALSPSQAPGVQLTDPFCSGTWAVIGISGPAPGPVVQLFRYADGAWQSADEDAACAAGELPGDIEPSVCRAG